MREYLFDDMKSIWHVILGLLVSLLGKGIPLLGVLIIVIYVVYEVLERENSVVTLGDIIEFIIGFMIGCLWWC